MSLGKNTLLLCFAMACLQYSYAQYYYPQVAYYEVEGKAFYEIGGCTPGSDIGFYSEKWGGKFIKSISINNDGKAFLEKTKDFNPAFALSTGKGGSEMVTFIEQKDFILENLEAEYKQSIAHINWDATVRQYEDHSFEVPARLSISKPGKSWRCHPENSTTDKGFHYTHTIKNPRCDTGDVTY